MAEYELMHYGAKGMRWGYNHGSRNGNRTAEEEKFRKAVDAAHSPYANAVDNAGSNTKIKKSKNLASSVKTHSSLSGKMRHESSAGKANAVFSRGKQWVSEKKNAVVNVNKSVTNRGRAFVDYLTSRLNTH